MTSMSGRMQVSNNKYTAHLHKKMQIFFPATKAQNEHSITAKLSVVEEASDKYFIEEEKREQ